MTSIQKTNNGEYSLTMDAVELKTLHEAISIAIATRALNSVEKEKELKSAIRNDDEYHITEYSQAIKETLEELERLKSFKKAVLEYFQKNG